MDDNNQGLSEAQKVKKLLKGVTSTNPEVIAIKAVVRSTHPTDFNRASNNNKELNILSPVSSIKVIGRPGLRTISRAATRV
jgi:hypothetical protein